MFAQILTSFVLQIVFTVGIIFLFGFLIALCNKQFYTNFGAFGRLVCYITGAVGTPVHECAHALFCVIFGHQVTEIKLFQINSADGTLGYVNHIYNPKNIYHKIGNFFIGVAPIIVISAILYVMAYLLLPEFLVELSADIKVVDFVADFGGALLSILSSVPIFFLYAVTWQWWLFLVIGVFLALHMTLSKPDIKGALSGLIFVLLAFLIVDVILGLIDGNLLQRFTSGVLGIASYLLCILVLSLIISVMALLISYCFRFGKAKILKKYGT